MSIDPKFVELTADVLKILYNAVHPRMIALRTRLQRHVKPFYTISVRTFDNILPCFPGQSHNNHDFHHGVVSAFSLLVPQNYTVHFKGP